MKKFTLFLLLLISSQWASAVTSIKAEVNGMVCAFCAKGIEKKLNAMPERQSSFVDLKRRIVVLEIKTGKDVPLDRFTEVIKNAGYTVSKVEQVNLTAEQIKAQLAEQSGEK
jgi:cation transport ATPase